MKDKVAIIGFGYVGKAMQKVFTDALLFDIGFFDEDGKAKNLPAPNGEQYPGVELGIEDAKRIINDFCGLAIVCVPTPMAENDEEFKAADISIVEDTVKWLETDVILIKLTVPPGTTDSLVKNYNKKIAFSPEFIGEGKYQITPWKYMDPVNPRYHEFQIFGGETKTCEEIANYFIKQLGPEKVYYLCSAVEGEIIKYMENSWGAMKVMFANEFYQICERFGASYIKVREGWALDNRVERMHTAVFVDKQGFGGKCYPKDLNAIVAAADQAGVDMKLIKTVLRKNKDINPENL